MTGESGNQSIESARLGSGTVSSHRGEAVVQVPHCPTVSHCQRRAAQRPFMPIAEIGLNVYLLMPGANRPAGHDRL